VRHAHDLPSHANFVILSLDHELAQAQVYPFHLYAAALSDRFGATFFELASSALTPSTAACGQVRWVAFQTWFDLTAAQMEQHVALIRTIFPNAALVYLDFFAPVDLRYAKVLDPWISHYVKKQVLADFSQYGEPTRGDTNLTDYCARRYQLEMPQSHFEVPPDFLGKLVVGTNFCLSAHIVDHFLRDLPDGERPIDLHARIATRGEEWYQKMREESRRAALAIDRVRTVSEGQVSRRRFFDEMRRSKLCFSPFGYGEVCWRDYEALFCGALLVKPRMDHVQLAPAIFIAGETYVDVEWDCSDLEEKVRAHLCDERRRRAIVHNGFEVVRQYIRSKRALDDLAPIFATA
jgi:hypothetical protein